MDLGRAFHAPVLAERAFDHRLSLPVPAGAGSWVVSYQDHPNVHLLSPELTTVQTLDLGAQSQAYSSTSVALSPDGRTYAVSARQELRTVNRDGSIRHRIAHPPWDSFAGSGCRFDPKGRLWYVRPGDKLGVNERVMVLDPDAGNAVAEQTIPNEVGFFDLHPCPAGDGMLIDIGCGQDGSFLNLARLTADGLVIEAYPYGDRTFTGSFSPDGREFVTGSHDGDAIKVHEYPSGNVVAPLISSATFAADTLAGESRDDVGYQAIFLSPEYILADTHYGRLLLIRRRGMRFIGTVWPPDYTLRGYDNEGKETDDPRRIIDYEGGITSIHPAGEGRVLIVFRERTIRLLDLQPVLSEVC